jgi:hypothetical protein
MLQMPGVRGDWLDSGTNNYKIKTPVNLTGAYIYFKIFDWFRIKKTKTGN